MGREPGRYIESPDFVFEISPLANNAYYIINLEKEPYKKYLPFNYLEIYNPDSIELKLEANDRNIKRTIPAGVVVTYEFPAIYDITIKNESGIDGTKQIIVTVKKLLTERELLKLIARRLGAI